MRDVANAAAMSGLIEPGEEMKAFVMAAGRMTRGILFVVGGSSAGESDMAT